MDTFKKIIAETEFYHLVFENMMEEIFVFNENGRCVYINPAAERSEGFSLDQVRGKQLLEIYDVEKEDSPTYLVLSTKKPVEDMVCAYLTGGREKIKTSSAFPIFNGEKFAGAFCIQRDFSQFTDMIDKNLELQTQLNQQKNHGESGVYEQHLIGESESFRYALSLAEMAAQSDSNVLLEGEDGCGKTTIAHYIHDHSSRRHAPFLLVDCASVPEELLEHLLFGTMGQSHSGWEKEGILSRLNGGTLFLKNITHLPGTVQMRLVRVLDENRDFRLICDSKVSSTDIVRKSFLHMDFFYNISVVQIRIPPLREREDDILLFMEYFMQKYHQRFAKRIAGVSQETISWFRIYSWPGNIRQFRTCIEAAMNYVKDGKQIMADDLPANIFYERRDEEANADGTAFCKRKLYYEAREKERDEIVKALSHTNGNISQASRYLGISRQLLYYRMKKYKL